VVGGEGVLSGFLAYFRLVRASNCVMASLAAVVGWFIVHSVVGGDLFSFIPLFVVVFLITGAGNALNDFFDVEIDRINQPNRPLPSGAISGRSALYLAVIFFVGGVGISGMLGSLCFVIAVVNSGVLVVYASHLKRTVLLGNLSVGYLTGSTFLFGGAVFGFDGAGVVLVLFLLATLTTISRELIKDVLDMEGDAVRGARTFPIVFGERAALYLSAVFLFVGIGLSPLPYFQLLPDGRALFGPLYRLIVAVADILFIAGIVASFRESAHSSTILKFAMLVALSSFVIGVLVR